MAKKVTTYRYVELAYELPGADKTQFRAWIDVADSPNAALEAAIEDCQRAHPSATGISEYMQRAVDNDKGAEIEKAILDGSWTGWDFERRGSDAVLA